MSFLFPLGLIALPIAVGGLLFFYREIFSGSRRSVPSLFLLAQLQLPPPKRTFKVPPKRFFLDSFLVLLLTLALAGLVFTSDRSAVVIDASLSMAALDGERSRFDRAVAMARTMSGDRFLLSNELRKVSQAELEIAKPEYARDNFSLAGLESYDQITFITDVTSELSPSSRVTVRSVLDPSGASRFGNIALTDASWRDEEVVVTVRSFAPRTVTGLVELRSEESQQTAATTFTVEPNSNKAVVVRRPPRGPLRIGLTKISDSSMDILAEDNQWAISARDSSAIRVVGGSIGPVPGVTVRDDPSLPTVVFGELPLPLQTTRAVRILEGGGANERIIRWFENHRLSQYLTRSDVALSGAVPVADRYGVAVWEGLSGALVRESRLSGQSILTLGFNPFPFSQSSPAVQKILLLNLVRWIAEGQAPMSPQEANSAPGFASIDGRTVPVVFYTAAESDIFASRSVSFAESSGAEPRPFESSPVTPILAGILLAALLLERFLRLREVNA